MGGKHMLLVGVRENEHWLLSRWELTYRCSWERILQGTSSVYDYYEQLQILIDDKILDIKDKTDIMSIKEADRLTFRGISTILKVPTMITFYNQLEQVDVSVAKATQEFQICDYKRFNMSLGKYMDSIELAMFR